MCLLASRRAKYELQHVVRTNLAANDAAFHCVYEQEDVAGQRGVKLSKELMAIAGEGVFRVKGIFWVFGLLV
jgi:3-ketoacyl-CoA synthase